MRVYLIPVLMNLRGMNTMSDKIGHSDSVITKNTQELRSRKEARQDRNFYIKCIVAVVAIAVAFVLCLLYNNQDFRKGMTAVTVNGEKFSATDLDYYYYTTISQYSSQYGTYLSYMGLDLNQDLDQQEYSDGKSWGDYFREQAVTMLSQSAAMYQDATKNGYEISDDLQQQIDDYSASIDSYCTSNSITREQFLQQRYGSSMTDEIFMKNLKMMFVASQYASDYQQNHEYSDDELNTYYDAHKNDIDLASYEVLTVNADYTGIEGTTKGSTDETPTYTKEQDKEALAAAEKTANAFLDRVNSGQSLSDIGDEFGSNYYSNKTDVSYSTYTNYAFDDWAFDESRTEGEASVVKDEDNNCWYVVVFHNRYRPDYNTVDVRHILIKPADSGLSSSDDGYEEAKATNDAYAKNQAQEVLNKYLAGEHTADAFGALAKEYSSDSNASDGGLYTRVYKGEMVDSFEDWCFDPSRKSGDTGIVETTYGYHVMYFQGTDIPYWQVRCINNLYTEWQNNIFDSAKVSKNSFGIKAVG